MSTINDKNLDYEIETISQRSSTPVTTTTINDKNLDYEIETLETQITSATAIVDQR